MTVILMYICQWFVHAAYTSMKRFMIIKRNRAIQFEGEENVPARLLSSIPAGPACACSNKNGLCYRKSKESTKGALL